MPSVLWRTPSNVFLPVGEYIEFELKHLKGISTGWPVVQFFILDAEGNILASKISSTTSSVVHCDANCYSCKSPQLGSCDSESQLANTHVASATECEIACNNNANCMWFSYCPSGGLCSARGTENECIHYSECFNLDSQSSSVITGFYSRPSIHAKRKIMLDHKTCTVCKNNYFLNFDGKCVDECPTEMTALGKGSQGKFCSRTWVPFAITTSNACAESLPIGISPIAETSNYGYFSTANKNYEHQYFLQRFFVDDVLQFEGLWKFDTVATLAERFSRASSDGEAISWRVVDDYDKYSAGSIKLMVLFIRCKYWFGIIKME